VLALVARDGLGISRAESNLNRRERSRFDDVSA
jgi:hypothetical protein